MASAAVSARNVDDVNSLFVEGYAPFTIDGETHKIYYQVAGDLSDKTVVPLVVLHGGPGFPSTIYYTHGDLTSDFDFDIPVVLYDQIGGGKSTHLPHKPSDFWTPELMSEQLSQLLEHLGIADAYHLLGHSWGGMLALHFTTTCAPHGLRGLVLVGTSASMREMDKDFARLIDEFPERLRVEARKQENGEEYDKKAVEEAEGLWFKQHVCRLEVTPPSFGEAMAVFEEDPSVNHSMMGKLPFKTVGPMIEFDVTADLPKITVPSLIINGEYDMSRECNKPLFHGIPKAKWVHFLLSSHMPFFEEREKYMRVVGEFLKSCGMPTYS